MRLSVRLLATESPETRGPGATLKTNLDIACEAISAKHAALVIDCGETKSGSRKHYWLILTPEAAGAPPPVNILPPPARSR